MIKVLDNIPFDINEKTVEDSYVSNLEYQNTLNSVDIKIEKQRAFRNKMYKLSDLSDTYAEDFNKKKSRLLERLGEAKNMLECHMEGSYEYYHHNYSSSSMWGTFDEGRTYYIKLCHGTKVIFDEDGEECNYKNIKSEVIGTCFEELIQLVEEGVFDWNLQRVFESSRKKKICD